MVKMSINYYKGCKDSLKIISQNWPVYKENCNNRSIKYSARTRTCRKSTNHTPTHRIT